MLTLFFAFYHNVHAVAASAFVRGSSGVIKRPAKGAFAQLIPCKHPSNQVSGVRSVSRVSSSSFFHNTLSIFFNSDPFNCVGVGIPATCCLNRCYLPLVATAFELSTGKRGVFLPPAKKKKRKKSSGGVCVLHGRMPFGGSWPRGI